MSNSSPASQVVVSNSGSGNEGEKLVVVCWCTVIISKES